MEWWIYVIVIGAIILLFVLSVAIMIFFLKRNKKKAFDAYEALIPFERKRFETILSLLEDFNADGRHLPKNILDEIENQKKDFEAVPVNLAEVKVKDDFLIIYFTKYIQEKKLNAKDKYKTHEETLKNELYLDVAEKKSPYWDYNRKAARYNALLNMTILTLFRVKEKNPSAPVL